MIWLASFPRSGNTFLRNILFEVYGKKSSTFHLQPTYKLDEDFLSYPFIKTHELPQELHTFGNLKAIYIVRDGRDALVSIAHHRSDIIEPGSDFYENLKAAIIAERGSFFGGWSGNVANWIPACGILIRYEDLVLSTEKVLERIEEFIGLPKGDYSKIPHFDELKFGKHQYGSWKDIDVPENEKAHNTELFYRRGKINGWKDEMPPELHELFWSFHGDTMERLGYNYDGEGINDINEDFDFQLKSKLGLSPFALPTKRYRVLIEASKLAGNDNDGIKRYLAELIKEFSCVVKNENSKWEIDLLICNKIQSLNSFIHSHLPFSQNGEAALINLESTLPLSWSQKFEPFLLGLIPQKFKDFLVRHHLIFLHQAYDNVKLLISKRRKCIKRVPYVTTNEFSTTIENRDLFLGDNSYDLVHLPLMQHFGHIQEFKVPLVTTIHDLTHISHPEFHTPQNIKNADAGLQSLKKSNSFIIAVSQSTKHDVLTSNFFPAEKVFMVHEACDRSKFNYKINVEDRSRVLKKYNIPDDVPYLLCLSTIEPRKNVQNTINAFLKLKSEKPDLHLNLIIAGKVGWKNELKFPVTKQIYQEIITTGFIHDDDIAAIYSGALAFCYVSFYEGFGLPLLEAMNCGIPVIFGNNSSMIEVVGEAGLGADASDIDDIKAQMQKLIFDKELCAELKLKALQQAAKFSWRKSAIETLAVYQRVIERVK